MSGYRCDMRLLFEESNRNEVDRIRLLLESNGIPVYIGNEDSARNFNFVALAQKYGVWVVEDHQYDCAKALLDDETYEVKEPVDVEEYHRMARENPVDVYSFVYQKIILPAFIFIVIFMIGLFIYLS